MLRRADNGSTANAARIPEAEPTTMASVLFTAPATMLTSGVTVRMVAVTKL
ncbi:hypothetical protein D3C72_2034810 [compost metagenome]